MLREVLVELVDVVAGSVDFVQCLDALPGILSEDRLGNPVEVLSPGDAENLGDRLVGHGGAAIGDDLVEQTLRIPHAPIGRLGDR